MTKLHVHAAAMFVLLSGVGCGSTTLSPDAGGGQAGTGIAGTHGGGGSTGTAGGGTTTGAAGSAGSVGSTGAAGTHGATDGGAGTGAAGKDGGACICSQIYAPVCGVDGKTYPSKCAADCAGIAVAHTGVCETPTKDGGTDTGTDAAPGHCDQDTDCITRPSGTCSCTGMCVAKTDPAPPPPKIVCAIVCPAIAIACSCVNHQCSALAIGAAP